MMTNKPATVFFLVYTFSKYVSVLLQPIPLSPYHSSQSLFFSLSKNLKQCFVENNAQLQKLYLSLSQKQVLFFIYTEVFYGSALLTLKTYALYPLGKMQRTWNWTDAGPKENNKLYHVSNHISSAFVFLLWTEIYLMQSIWQFDLLDWSCYDWIPSHQTWNIPRATIRCSECHLCRKIMSPNVVLSCLFLSFWNICA